MFSGSNDGSPIIDKTNLYLNVREDGLLTRIPEDTSPNDTPTKEDGPFGYTLTKGRADLTAESLEALHSHR
jgi:hypothetical protein